MKRLLCVIALYLIFQVPLYAQELEIEPLGVQYQAQGTIQAMEISDDQLFLASDAEYLRIMNIENDDPVLISETYLGEPVTGMVVLDQTIWLASPSAGLIAYDISNLEEPLPAGTWFTNQYAIQSLQSVGERLYAKTVVGNGFSEPGVLIVSLENPDQPEELAFHSLEDAYDCAFSVQDDTLFMLLDGVTIYNVADAEEWVQISHSPIPEELGLGYYDYAVTFISHYAYLSGGVSETAGASFFRILDIEDLENPVALESYSGMGSGEMRGIGNYLLLTGGSYTPDDPPGDVVYDPLHVLDISDPETPELVTRLDVHHAQQMRLHGDQLYINSRQQDGPFTIVDCSDPIVPSIVAEYNLEESISGAAVGN